MNRGTRQTNDGDGRPRVISDACRFFQDRDPDRAWKTLCANATTTIVERWADELAVYAGVSPTELLHLFGERRHDPEYSEPAATPKPLGVTQGPPFPVAVLPRVLRRFVEEVAAAFQVAPDVVAICVLAVLAIAGAHRVHIKLNQDWREDVNLALLLALPSGERKSPVLRAVKAVLEQIQRLERKRMAPEIARASARKRLLEIKADRTARNYAAGKGSQEAAEQAGAERDLFAVPTTTLVLAANTTPEKLVSDICDQNGRLGIIDDEGAFLANVLGRYGGDRSAFDPIEDVLKCISNDSLGNRRRTPGRDCDHPRPALTVLAVIQPALLEHIRSRPLASERGFLPRFGFALPASSMGRRRVYDVPELSKVAEHAYSEAVRAIYELPTPLDEFGHPDPPALKLDDDARKVLLDYAASVELRLRPGAELTPIQAWAGKQPGRVARIAALLHLAEHGARSLSVPLSRVTAVAAVEIGGYLEQHAFAAFGLTVGHELDAPGVYLLRKWIDAGGRPATTKALLDMARVLGTASRLCAVLEHLRDEHALVDGPQHIERPGRGRRASPLWKLHPDAAEFCVNCVIGVDSALDRSSSSLSQETTKSAEYADYAESREPGSDHENETPAVPEGAFS